MNVDSELAGELREGDRLYQRREFAAALPHYLRCVQISLGAADLHYRVGCAAWKADRVDLVEPHLLEALRLDPNHARAIEAAGQWYFQINRPDRAREFSARAVALEPENPDFSLSHAYVIAEDSPNEAWARIEPLLADEERADRAAILYARIAPRIGREHQAADWIGRRLAGSTTSAERPQLHFALSSLLDHLGRHEEAFDQASRAHAAAPRPHDPIEHSRRIDRRIAFGTAELLRSLPHATHGSRRPVFIVGMPRSGTSLVEQILSRHPQVFGAGELDDISRAGRTLDDPRLPYPGVLQRLTPEMVDRKAGEYLTMLRTLNADATHVTDKMPLNFLYLDVIELLFPQSRIIHCVRDPLDTCVSCHMTDFEVGNAFAWDLKHLGAFHRDYERLMRHWRTVISVPILDVRYEDVVSDLEGQTRRMLEFLELPWEPRCLEFHAGARRVTTASRDQVRRPLYSSSVGRWRRYESRLGELIAALNG